MFSSTEWVEVLDEATAVGTMIGTSEIGVEYLRCKKELEEDHQAQVLIQSFVKVKDVYEEVRRFGKYHPDYETVSKEIREKKRQVDMYERIVNFKKAERNLQKLLDEISGIIGFEVSADIKVPTGNPFFDSKSCSGGCSSGGSCGCKKG